MTPSEAIVADAFAQGGWHVLKDGWPDFLMFNEDGRVRFVEVKGSCRNTLSPRQDKIAKVLALIGIEVELVPTRCDCSQGNCLKAVAP